MSAYGRKQTLEGRTTKASEALPKEKRCQTSLSKTLSYLLRVPTEA